MKKLFLSFSVLLAAFSANAQVSTCTYTGMLLASGTAGPATDDATMPTTIPFTFNFYGSGYTGAIISSNGFIWLGTDNGDRCCDGLLIPSDGALTVPYIALTHSDWVPGSSGGSIFYNTIGSAPNRIYVVHFENVINFGSANRLTGEIQLYETTNEIRLVISSLTGFGGSSGTFGTMGMAAGDGVTGEIVSGRNRVTSYTASNECWSLSSSSTVLPVTLLIFDARKAGQSAQINWSTGVEENNKFFSIERSTNGSDFQRIATVNSKGNTTFGHQYSVTDAHPLAGKNIYRLVQYDLDNKATHYGSRTLDFGDLKTPQIEPNPFTDYLNIKIPGGANSTVEIVVTDVLGKEISRRSESLDEGGKSVSITSKDWPAGFYSVKISRDGQTENYKVMKQ